MTSLASRTPAITNAAHALHFPGRVRHQPNARTIAIRAKRDPDSAERMLHHLAERYGSEIASQTLSHYEAIERLGLIALAHWQIGPERFDEVMGRVETTLGRFADVAALNAAADIRAGLQPLLTRRAPTAKLRERAYELSSARLLRPDCDAIVRDEVAKRLATSACTLARAAPPQRRMAGEV